MKAFSYTRFSSGTQAKGSSKERQEELVREYLAQNPKVTFIEELSFKDLGISGWSGKHLDSGMGKLLAAIETGKIGKGYACLVESLDRVGRLAPTDMLELLQKIINSGVSIITLEDGIEYSKETLNQNAGHLFILMGKIQQANQYSESLSKRIRASYSARRKIAKTGGVGSVKRRTPFFLDSQTGVLKQPEAKVVAECFEQYIAGKGERQLARFVAEKLPDMKGINPSTVKRILKNRACIGYWEDSRVYESVVTEDIFYAVQEAIKSRRPKKVTQSRKYLLSGLVKCADCGSNFSVKNNKHADAGMTCAKRARLGDDGCHNGKSVAYDVLDWIRNECQFSALDRYHQSLYKEQVSKEITILSGKLEEVDSKIANLIEVLAKTYSDQATNKLKEFEGERSEILSRIHKIEVSEDYDSADVDIGLLADLEDDLMSMEDRTLANRLYQSFDFAIYCSSSGSIQCEDYLFSYAGFSRKEKMYILEMIEPNEGFIKIPTRKDMINGN